MIDRLSDGSLIHKAMGLVAVAYCGCLLWLLIAAAHCG
jgi:hypothetical protein